MKQHRHTALVIVLLITAAAAGFGVYEWLAPLPAPSGVETANAPAAPAMSLSEALNRPLDNLEASGTGKLADWRGKALLVNFWATWCGPCREEIPLLVKLQAKYAAQGLQVIGIATDETDEAVVKAFLQKSLLVNYPMLMGDDGVAGMVSAFGGQLVGLPYTVVLDRNGNPLKLHAGELHPQEAEKLIQAALLMPVTPTAPSASTAPAQTSSN